MAGQRTKFTKGFARASTLVQSRVRSASEGRGFAQSRLLTHWEEVVGADIAKTAQPVKITYGRGGMGATLTLLTTGAMAPMLEMQKEQVREKVNICYGYNAVSHIRITQTAPIGFHEGRVAFEAAPKISPKVDGKAVAKARDAAQSVKSDELRSALEALGTQIISKSNR